MNLVFFADDLTRLGITHTHLLNESGLNYLWKEVRCPREKYESKLVCFEQVTPRNYSGRASDVIPDLVSDIKDKIWVAVSIMPPYRKYYIYLAPSAESLTVIPQLLSIYAVMYYLGSSTRYRPHHFEEVLDDLFGSRIEEFITGQPMQFIYLLASEFAQKEITRPAIV